MTEVNKINRFIEPPKDGVFCDILWADPCENDEEAIAMGWSENSSRGCSYVFG